MPRKSTYYPPEEIEKARRASMPEADPEHPEHVPARPGESLNVGGKPRPTVRVDGLPRRRHSAIGTRPLPAEPPGLKWLRTPGKRGRKAGFLELTGEAAALRDDIDVKLRQLSLMVKNEKLIESRTEWLLQAERGNSSFQHERASQHQQPIAERIVKDELIKTPESAFEMTVDRLELERQHEVAQAALREQLREAARADFWFFVTEVLYPDTWRKHYIEGFHSDLCNRVTTLGWGESIWFFLPRGHRKSMLFTIANIVWSIVRDPNVRCMLVGAREETSKPFARLILSAFVKGTPGFEKFQWVFSDFVFDADQRGSSGGLQQALQFIVPNRTQTLADPTFRATYLGVTGAGWRCDKLWLDDAVERRNVTSPEMSVQTLNKMLDFLPLVDKTGRYAQIVGCGTRWAHHDPYGKLIGDTSDDGELDQSAIDAAEAVAAAGGAGFKTHVIVRHALESPDRPCDVCPPSVVAACPHGAPDFAKGEPVLYPIITKTILAAELDKYMVNPQQGESLWWAQYMNVCKAPRDQKIRPEWLDFRLDRADWPLAKRRVLVIDDASKDFQAVGVGDYSVAVFASFDDEGRVCLRHGLRSNRWTRDEFIRTVVSWCRATGWWPHVVAKEKMSVDNFLADVQREFLNVLRPVTVMPVSLPKTLKKYDRIVGALQQPLESGLIVWGSQFPDELRQRAIHELTNVGSVSHDDVADALTLLMAPGVRVEAIRRQPRQGASAWRSPSMENYGVPPKPLPDQPVSQFDAAVESPQVRAAMDALPGEGQWKTAWARPGSGAPTVSFKPGIGGSE